MHEESVLITVPQDKATGENRHAEETPAVQYMHVFIHLLNIYIIQDTAIWLYSFIDK